MMSLFTSFDYNMFWPYMILFTLLTMNLNNTYYLITIKETLMSKMSKFMGMFFLSLKPKNFNKNMKILILSIFTTLMTLNFAGVSSYNFATTSQTSVVLYLSMTVWISYIMFTIANSAKGLMTHLIPEGTPIYLTWFLFMIEIISNIIRPVTISVRLMANILAGHLLMILLSKLVMKMNFITVLYLGLNMVEMFVSIIQAYIFATMMTLYYSEMN